MPPLDLNGSRGEINPELVVSQHACANEDFVTIDKRRLHANDPVIEREIDEKDIFFDALICRQQ
jgi:hypothetical protein